MRASAMALMPTVMTTRADDETPRLGDYAKGREGGSKISGALPS